MLFKKMTYKILVLAIFIALQFASVYTQFNPATIKKQIQKELQESIKRVVPTLWQASSTEQNIQFAPLSAYISFTSVSISLLQKFYPNDTDIEKKLPEPYFLAKEIDTYQNKSDIKLKFHNVVFHDQKNITNRLLNQLKGLFHTEIYNISVTPENNETALAPVNLWILQNSKGRAEEINNLTWSIRNYIQISLISYTSCWDKPKTLVTPTKEWKFKTFSNQEINVEAFNGKEKIAYYDDPNLKLEVIRIPYKNSDFEMFVVLPYEGHSLADAHSPPQTIFQSGQYHYENIDYVIPVMNLKMISLTENGTSVNGDEPIVCDFSSSTLTQQQSPSTNDSIVYKPFYVNRPFGVYIYDNYHGYILVYTLVKNPQSNIPISQTDIGGYWSQLTVMYKISNLYAMVHGID